MTRITPVYRPADYPGNPDAQTRQDLAALFELLHPGLADPEIDKPHTGTAIAALSPGFAIALTRLTRSVVLDLPWSQRKDLMELAVQAINLHYRCDFSFEARLPLATATGVGLERIAALPYWRSSSLFDDEQRLVLAFVEATLAGDVPDDLLAQARASFGERGMVELTAVVGTFSMWAMLINMARPSLA